MIGKVLVKSATLVICHTRRLLLVIGPGVSEHVLDCMPSVVNDWLD